MWELFFGEDARSWWWAWPGLCVTVVAAPWVAWAAAMSMPVTTMALAGWVGVALAAILLRSGSVNVMLLASPLLALPFWRVPLEEANHAFRQLRDVVVHDGVEALTERDLWCIWAVHEAVEHGSRALGFSMVPATLRALGEEGPAVRAWDGAAAMRDPRVREVVDRFVGAARNGSRQPLGPVALAWPDWAGTEVSPDVATALDCPSEVTGAVVPEGVRVEVRCHVEWREGAWVFAEVDTRRMVFDQILFDALERRGWLRPYDAVWTWTVGLDEPSLTGREARLGAGERAWLALRGWLTR